VNNFTNMIFLATALFVGGCGGHVDSEYLDSASRLCGQNGGLDYLSILAAKEVTCKNGASFSEYDWDQDVSSAQKKGPN